MFRGLTTGVVDVSLMWHALYLAVMGVTGLTIASRRLGHLLLQ
jgi:lipooligosaccharide transport system permease protein